MAENSKLFGKEFHLRCPGTPDLPLWGHSYIFQAFTLKVIFLKKEKVAMPEGDLGLLQYLRWSFLRQ